MKITAFISNLSKGGAQGVFVTVVNYLKNNGHEVDVVVQNLDDAIHAKKIHPDIHIESLNVQAAKELFKPLKLYLKTNHVEYALVFSPEMSVMIYLAKKLTHGSFPICARCMNTLSVEYANAETFFRKYVTNWSLKKFYHKVDKVIAQSEGMGEDFIKNYGFLKEQVSIINNSLAVEFEKELDADNEIEKENYILYAGRLEKQKGLEMLLLAFSRMKNNTMKLYLIGNGSKRQELEEKARELNIADRVRFIEYTTEIVAYYKKAKVTALSSYYEGFPNVLVESLACGTPVVAFDLPSGPKEIIVEDQNGYLVEHLNIIELATALDKAVNKEWDVSAIKQTAARYRQSIIMEKYLDTINSIMPNNK